ncbi:MULTISPECIES: hypothetical protein [Thermomonospora]|uniref:Uncharacterized protein n=1 Tax=Thermomonospora curvata (strain ATCC 19995 / DSM 43183 / JCM 3096 / KCTC 9072 / NBRC 15933 / NCIMB 10081 / Henssen B9) TaxID=471852 RepID=D1A343_THECD|nr:MULTISPECIES: hypothetical protein [Thermomonospora]ACY99813.1 hypothetical protein Tcur_4286 [Thermomonospora curvata DSM 43183]PKK12817.1 MAG: hypothetical protein BUE48_021050 [Thermomonospora sp. CIF 1]
MGYPGDQGSPDDRPPEPYGPEQAGADRPGGEGASPFSPPPGAFAARPGERFGGESFDRSFPTGRFDTGPGGRFGLGSFDDDGAAAPDGGSGFADRPGAGNPPWASPSPPEPPHRPGDGGPAGREPAAGPSGGELYGAMGERYFADDGGFSEPAGHRKPDKDGADSKRGLPLPVTVGGAVLAGLLLVGGGFAASSALKGGSGDGKAAAAPQQPTATPTATPTPSLSAAPLNIKLKSRATDPKPLTLKEVFGKASFTAKGKKYVRTAWKHERNCSKAVNGGKLAATLKKGGCVQVLRATYARADGLLVGTVGVLNLKTDKWARAAQKAGAGRDAYLQPLPGTGYSKKIGKGAALGTSRAHGHYLIMTWVQRPDGKTIAKKYHRVVSDFQQQIILGSNLGRALHYRGIEGKPLTG